MEDKIVDFIKQEYDPEVILLAGSRAKGRETKQSDWDLFLIGSKKGNGGHADFEGEDLDITFKSWPEEHKPLTIPFGPLWPVRVLQDNSAGRLEKVLAKTKEDFDKGPLMLYKDSVLGRWEKLESNKRKLEKCRENLPEEFSYAGRFYDLVLQEWFEFQNLWATTSPSDGYVRLFFFPKNSIITYN